MDTEDLFFIMTVKAHHERKKIKKKRKRKKDQLEF